MATGEETEIALSTFVSGYYNITLSEQLADLEINGEAFDFGSLFKCRRIRRMENIKGLKRTDYCGKLQIRRCWQNGYSFRMGTAPERSWKPHFH